MSSEGGNAGMRIMFFMFLIFWGALIIGVSIITLSAAKQTIGSAHLVARRYFNISNDPLHINEFKSWNYENVNGSGNGNGNGTFSNTNQSSNSSGRGSGSGILHGNSESSGLTSYVMNLAQHEHHHSHNHNHDIDKNGKAKVRSDTASLKLTTGDIISNIASDIASKSKISSKVKVSPNMQKQRQRHMHRHRHRRRQLTRTNTGSSSGIGIGTGIELLSLGKPVKSSVRGNLGPADVVTSEYTKDWLHDRWQAAKNMKGEPIPGEHFLEIDLQREALISHIVIDWEDGYSDRYVRHYIMCEF